MSDEQLKRGKPVHALGGGAQVDHLFRNGRSLCDKYMWGGGEPVDEEEVEYEPGQVCKTCCRKLGVVNDA